MFVIIWGLVGFYMVLFIAAIKGVPAEVFEAARIDGAGRFRTAVSITIPLIRENVQTAFIYIGILALDAFVYMAALEPGGGPGQHDSCHGPTAVHRPFVRASSAMPARWVSCSRSSPWRTRVWCSL